MTRLWPEGEAIEIEGAQDGPPDEFCWRGQSHRVQAVCNRWRVHTRWWEPEQVVWREYLKLATDTGLLCLIYHDLDHGGWFLTRVYD